MITVFVEPAFLTKIQLQRAWRALPPLLPVYANIADKQSFKGKPNQSSEVFAIYQCLKYVDSIVQSVVSILTNSKIVLQRLKNSRNMHPL